MKKSIDSRKKSKKARLAAGVLAIILAMFPSAAKAEIIYPGERAPIANGTVPQDQWEMNPNGHEDDVMNLFFGNNTIGEGEYYEHGTRWGLGHYVESTRFILGNGTGTLTVSGWVGRAAQSGDDLTEAMTHLGGAATLSFLGNIANTYQGNGAAFEIGGGTFTLQAIQVDNVLNSDNSTWHENSSAVDDDPATDEYNNGTDIYNEDGPRYQVNQSR